jgi:hypothetical protein
MIETGELWADGPRAFVSASRARKRPVPRSRRDQQEAVQRPHLLPAGGPRLHLGCGHYNQNRNNFYRNPNINDIRTRAGQSSVHSASQRHGTSSRSPIRPSSR